MGQRKTPYKPRISRTVWSQSSEARRVERRVFMRLCVYQRAGRHGKKYLLYLAMIITRRCEQFSRQLNFTAQLPATYNRLCQLPHSGLWLLDVLHNNRCIPSIRDASNIVNISSAVGHTCSARTDVLRMCKYHHANFIGMPLFIRHRLVLA